ncbi:MAG: alanine racemase [Pigmentiphaga sp.]|nr:alanine racemase [Pigmentiphaga sp.]
MDAINTIGPVGFVRPTWCEIDLSAIDHNIAQIRSLTGDAVQVYVCMKGDASGCGAVPVALRAGKAGASGLTFGNIDVAISCREAGSTLPILLYPGCLPEQAPILERYDLQPTISTLEDVKAWSARVGTRLSVFIKIDSGGFRAGAFPHQVAEVARAVVDSGNLHLAGVYGHALSAYGGAVAGFVDQQIANFVTGIEALQEAGIAVPLRMCSSSELLLSHPGADFNAVDPGRLVAGIGFKAVPERIRAWRPALVGLKSRLVMVKSLDRHDGVAAPPFFVLRPGMRLGLVPFGWGDGHPRHLSPDAHVLIRGRKAPLLGPVHSELLRIDLTDIPDAQLGDEVVFIGRSGRYELTVDDLAAQWREPAHDVYWRIGKTVHRVYVS